MITTSIVTQFYIFIFNFFNVQRTTTTTTTSFILMTRILFGAAPILQIMHGSIVIHVNDVAGLICIPCIVFLFFLFLLRDDVSCCFFFRTPKIKDFGYSRAWFFWRRGRRRRGGRYRCIVVRS